MHALVALSDLGTVATSLGVAFLGAAVGGTLTYIGTRKLDAGRGADAEEDRMLDQVTELQALARVHADAVTTARALVNSCLAGTAGPRTLTRRFSLRRILSTASGEATTQTCEPVIFTPNSDDATSEIEVSGSDCEGARTDVAQADGGESPAQTASQRS